MSADGNKLVVADGEQGSVAGLVYTSTNSGVTLTPTSAPTNYWSSVASSADGRELVAASIRSIDPSHLYGCVYTSTNFGMAWTSNSVPDAQWSGVASSADGTKLAAISVEPHGMIYTSTNSGTTWVSNNVPDDYWMGIASSADGNRLLATPMADVGFGPVLVYLYQTFPSPNLNVSSSAANVAINWLIPSTNFVLQLSPDLAGWSDVTNAPVLNLTNLQYEVTLPLSVGNAFYRLKTP